MLAGTVSQQLSGASALLVGIVLLWAGWSKATSTAVFATQVAAYDIVPESAAPLLARLISSSELLAGALLLAGLVAPPELRQIGAGLACLLFLMFLGALVSAQARGRQIACACFGGSGELETVGPHSIVRTSLLFMVALLANIPIHKAQPIEIVVLAALVAALVALASEIARLFGPLRRTTNSILEQFKATVNSADKAEVIQ